MNTYHTYVYMYISSDARRREALVSHCVTEVAQVKHLMGGKDAADVAAWAHKASMVHGADANFDQIRWSLQIAADFDFHQWLHRWTRSTLGPLSCTSKGSLVPGRAKYQTSSNMIFKTTTVRFHSVCWSVEVWQGANWKLQRQQVVH